MEPAVSGSSKISVLLPLSSRIDISIFWYHRGDNKSRSPYKNAAPSRRELLEVTIFSLISNVLALKLRPAHYKNAFLVHSHPFDWSYRHCPWPEWHEDRLFWQAFYPFRRPSRNCYRHKLHYTEDQQLRTPRFICPRSILVGSN